MLDLAVTLKLEAPGRTAAQIAEIITVSNGWSPSARTIQREFARRGLNVRPDGTPPQVFGRFEAAAPNDRWTGDALHGPASKQHCAMRSAPAVFPARSTSIVPTSGLCRLVRVVPAGWGDDARKVGIFTGRRGMQGVCRSVCSGLGWSRVGWCVRGLVP